MANRHDPQTIRLTTRTTFNQTDHLVGQCPVSIEQLSQFSGKRKELNRLLTICRAALQFFWAAVVQYMIVSPLSHLASP
jgi:hypothetical protein